MKHTPIHIPRHARATHIPALHARASPYAYTPWIYTRAHYAVFAELPSAQNAQIFEVNWYLTTTKCGGDGGEGAQLCHSPKRSSTCATKELMAQKLWKLMRLRGKLSEIMRYLSTAVCKLSVIFFKNSVFLHLRCHEGKKPLVQLPD